MSYGYQGPPFPGQNKPPTSFGLPPGTPSGGPSAPPYPLPTNQPPTSFGFPQPISTPPYPQSTQQQPTSFGMPQPNSTYPNPTHPPEHFFNPNSRSAPNYPPSQPNQSYPGSQPHQAYPGSQPHSTYPGSQPHQPYPNSQPAYPSPLMQQFQSGPPQTPYSAPGMPQYPPTNSTLQNPQPYPSTSYLPNLAQGNQHNYSNVPNPNPRSGLYPSLNNLEHELPNPGMLPMHGSKTSPYPGGGYSGGQGNGNFNYGGPVPAPRITKARNKLSPTVQEFPNFDPRSDAEVLRKAMKGFGTDEKSIIQVLANRTNLQRQQIAEQFKTLYGKDLIKDLKSETSGNFEKLLVAMMTPLPQYFAKELHEAMSGIGTEENVLIEILCTMSNHEIRIIKQAYESMFGKSLEDDLSADTSGNFERLMISLCCANRDETFEVDAAAATEDARQLLQAGELRFGTDESVFNAVLAQRNIAQLRAIFEQYQYMTGHDIEQAIENEFSGDIKKGLLAIVKCVKNRAGFFAEQLYKSMKGMGTQDRRLIRLVVTRSEIDMGEIKEAFLQQYGQSLESFISDDCSGHYKKCLLALIA
ncbi:hypothetical protein TKK_0008857 [Trichogramma kaykai]|uniref:Annexin n=1 Tax=Trichogramma kaykai TaxID=54128 RepID=A0ABD2X3W0_9HYME